jgi:hypothetical protein
MQLRFLQMIKAIVYDFEEFWFAFLPQKAQGLYLRRPFHLHVDHRGRYRQGNLLTTGLGSHPMEYRNWASLGKKGAAQALSAYLDTLQAKHYLLQTGQPITAEVIRNLVLGRKAPTQGERPRMLMEIFKHHNDQMAALVGREFAAGTLDRYVLL